MAGKHDMVRPNILFYSAFDQKRYKTMVAAGGLLVDLEQLPGPTTAATTLESLKSTSNSIATT